MYKILFFDNTLIKEINFEELLLRYNSDYEVFEAKNKDEIIEILSKQSIDLIVADISVDHFGGFEIIKFIKKYFNLGDLPILFLTSKNDDDTLENIFDIGVDFLAKPINKHELLLRTKKYLEYYISKKKLFEEEYFYKDIYDNQLSKVFIMDNDTIINANKSFLEFFKVKTLKGSKKKYNCILDLFMEYENYFSIHTLNDGEVWQSELSKYNNNKEYNVLLMDISCFEPKAFKIEVANIDNSTKYIVSLTDITSATEKSNRFESRATFDPLTNVYNRGKFNELTNEYYKLFRRYDKPLSFALFDLDFFKKVNDTYGHLIGDETLKRFASIISETSRETDIFARWGGEEFVLLMPQTNLDQAYIAAEKLRHLVAQTPFKEVGQITCSIGISQFRKGDTIDDVIKRVDDALYEAKNSGRNKVVKC